MAQHDPVPGPSKVTRWVKPKLLVADDDGEVLADANGNPLRVFPKAFALREDEEYLSVTSIDFFGAAAPQNLKDAANAVRESQDSKKLSGNGAFVVATVDATSECCQRHGHKVRILEEPVENNEGHVAIRRFPFEVGQLHDELANDTFSERHFYRSLK